MLGSTHIVHTSFLTNDSCCSQLQRWHLSSITTVTFRHHSMYWRSIHDKKYCFDLDRFQGKIVESVFVLIKEVLHLWNDSLSEGRYNLVRHCHEITDSSYETYFQGRSEQSELLIMQCEPHRGSQWEQVQSHIMMLHLLNDTVSVREGTDKSGTRQELSCTWPGSLQITQWKSWFCYKIQIERAQLVVVYKAQVGRAESVSKNLKFLELSW